MRAWRTEFGPCAPRPWTASAPCSTRRHWACWSAWRTTWSAPWLVDERQAKRADKQQQYHGERVHDSGELLFFDVPRCTSTHNLSAPWLGMGRGLVAPRLRSLLAAERDAVQHASIPLSFAQYAAFGGSSGGDVPEHSCVSVGRRQRPPRGSSVHARSAKPFGCTLQPPMSRRPQAGHRR